MTCPAVMTHANMLKEDREKVKKFCIKDETFQTTSSTNVLLVPLMMDFCSPVGMAFV